MGTPKVNVPEFIRSLGSQIEKQATPDLQTARRLAGESQDRWLEAGKAGGIPCVIACLFAAEYAEQSWDTKIQEAGQFNDGAEKIATEWENTEEKNMVKGE